MPPGRPQAGGYVRQPVNIMHTGTCAPSHCAYVYLSQREASFTAQGHGCHAGGKQSPRIPLHAAQAQTLTPIVNTHLLGVCTIHTCVRMNLPGFKYMYAKQANTSPMARCLKHRAACGDESVHVCKQVGCQHAILRACRYSLRTRTFACALAAPGEQSTHRTGRSLTSWPVSRSHV